MSRKLLIVMPVLLLLFGCATKIGTMDYASSTFVNYKIPRTEWVFGGPENYKLDFANVALHGRLTSRISS